MINSQTLVIVILYTLFYTQNEFFASAVTVEVTLYEDGHFEGNSSHVVTDRCVNVPADFNDATSSAKSKGCVMLWEHACCQGLHYQIHGEHGRIPLSFNDLTTSVSPCGDYRSGFPESVVETWLSQNQTMTKKLEDHPVAIYFNDEMVMSDDDLSSNLNLIKRIWNYTKHTYGYFGPEDGPLSVFFHANDWPIHGFMSRLNYFDWRGSCRNLIDLPSPNTEFWNKPLSGIQLDILVHEISHIVEGASKRLHGSPTSGFWKDSKWAEIFIYDIYSALELNEEKERWYTHLQTNKDDFPRNNTFWFRDWFYPVYSNHGGAQVLNKYFDLLARYWPKWVNGYQYFPQTVNLGEFVHFFSAAAGTDLKPQAKIAFQWDDAAEYQLEMAKHEFAQLKY